MAVKVDENGRPLFLRDGRLATKNYGLEGSKFTNVPKNNFLFYVNFVMSDGETANKVGFVVQKVDRPSLNFTTETLNQYNKKRVVQTKVEYNPLNITFYDTIDNRARLLFQDYFRYYYGDGNKNSDMDWSYDITTSEFFNFPGGWGYLSSEDSPNSSYFFTRIEIYEIYDKQYTRYDIVNPKITQLQNTDLDYTDTSGISEIVLSLIFEGIVYVEDNTPITSEVISLLGLDKSDFFEMWDSEQSINLSETQRLSRVPDPIPVINEFYNDNSFVGVEVDPILQSTESSLQTVPPPNALYKFTNDAIVRSLIHGNLIGARNILLEQALKNSGINIPINNVNPASPIGRIINPFRGR